MSRLSQITKTIVVGHNRANVGPLAIGGMIAALLSLSAYLLLWGGVDGATLAARERLAEHAGGARLLAQSGHQFIGFEPDADRLIGPLEVQIGKAEGDGSLAGIERTIAALEAVMRRTHETASAAMRDLHRAGALDRANGLAGWLATWPRRPWTVDSLEQAKGIRAAHDSQLALLQPVTDSIERVAAALPRCPAKAAIESAVSRSRATSATSSPARRTEQLATTLADALDNELWIELENRGQDIPLRDAFSNCTDKLAANRPRLAGRTALAAAACDESETAAQLVTNARSLLTERDQAPDPRWLGRSHLVEARLTWPSEAAWVALERARHQLLRIGDPIAVLEVEERQLRLALQQDRQPTEIATAFARIGSRLDGVLDSSSSPRLSDLERATMWQRRAALETHPRNSAGNTQRASRALEAAACAYQKCDQRPKSAECLVGAFQLASDVDTADDVADARALLSRARNAVAARELDPKHAAPLRERLQKLESVFAPRAAAIENRGERHRKLAATANALARLESESGLQHLATKTLEEAQQAANRLAHGDARTRELVEALDGYAKQWLHATWEGQLCPKVANSYGEHFRRIAEIAKAVDRPLCAARALLASATALNAVTPVDQGNALARLEQATAAFRRTNNRWWLAECLDLAGIVMHKQGDAAAAKRFEDALELLEQGDPQLPEAQSLDYAARVGQRLLEALHTSGANDRLGPQRERVARVVRLAADAAAGTGNHIRAGDLWHSLGQIHRRARQWTNAEAAFASAARAYEASAPSASTEARLASSSIAGANCSWRILSDRRDQNLRVEPDSYAEIITSLARARDLAPDVAPAERDKLLDRATKARDEVEALRAAALGLAQATATLGLQPAVEVGDARSHATVTTRLARQFRQEVLEPWLDHVAARNMTAARALNKTTDIALARTCRAAATSLQSIAAADKPEYHKTKCLASVCAIVADGLGKIGRALDATTSQHLTEGLEAARRELEECKGATPSRLALIDTDIARLQLASGQAGQAAETAARALGHFNNSPGSLKVFQAYRVLLGARAISQETCMSAAKWCEPLLSRHRVSEELEAALEAECTYVIAQLRFEHACGAVNPAAPASQLTANQRAQLSGLRIYAANWTEIAIGFGNALEGLRNRETPADADPIDLQILRHYLAFSDTRAFESGYPKGKMKSWDAVVGHASAVHQGSVAATEIARIRKFVDADTDAAASWMGGIPSLQKIVAPSAHQAAPDYAAVSKRLADEATANAQMANPGFRRAKLARTIDKAIADWLRVTWESDTSAWQAREWQRLAGDFLSLTKLGPAKRTTDETLCVGRAWLAHAYCLDQAETPPDQVGRAYASAAALFEHRESWGFAEALVGDGDALRRSGKPKSAIRAFEKSIKPFLNAGEFCFAARSYLRIAHTQRDIGRAGDARQTLQTLRTQDWYRKVPHSDQNRVTELLARL